MAPHTCWCPRPPDLCAAGTPSSHLTSGDLVERQNRYWPREKPHWPRGPCPCGGDSLVSAGGSASSCHQVHSETPQVAHCHAPGSGSRLLLPVWDTHSQAGRIPPRMSRCPGWWAGEAQGGSAPAPGLRVPRELLTPTGGPEVSSEFLTPAQAAVGKERGTRGEWRGYPMGPDCSVLSGTTTAWGPALFPLSD